MLKDMEAQVAASPEGQVSLTDPDARSMATSGRGSGIVGYNVQSAVEVKHHLIVAHDVVMTGRDRDGGSLRKVSGAQCDNADEHLCCTIDAELHGPGFCAAAPPGFLGMRSRLLRPRAFSPLR